VQVELTRAALRRGRVGVVVRVLSVAALVAAVVSFYPSIKGDVSLDKSFGELPDAVRAFLGSNSIISPVGYLTSRLFAWIIPFVLISLMVGRGAAAVAGEEESHTLNLVLAHPVQRRSAVLQRLAAMVGELIVVSALGVWVPLVALSGVSDINIGVGYETAAVVEVSVLALAFGALALAVGASTGRRSIALGFGSGLAVTGYVVSTLSRVVDALKPLRPVTVWRWYDGHQPLTDGIDVADTGVLILLSMIVVAIGIVLFERRDVRE
jgi:ABC-2 type transport system permease protein